MPKTLYDLNLLAGTEEDISIILVPGVGSRSPRDWEFCKGEWLSFLKKFPEKLRIYEIQHGLTFDGSFSWQTLRENAGEILDEIFESSEQPNQSSREHAPKPIIFLAHSLGAVLLKQIFCIANFQPDKYRSLLYKVAGIVFIGGPHDLPNIVDLSGRVLNLFKCFAKESISKKAAGIIRENAIQLREISVQYVNMGFNVRVLSVFEKYDSEIRGSRLSLKKTKVKIADEAFVTIHSRNEKPVEAPRTHRDICDLLDENSKPIPDVMQWLQEVIERAVNEVQKQLQRYQDVLSHSVEMASVTSLNVGRYIMHQSFDRMTVEDDTLEAQQGSTGMDQELVPLISGMHEVQREAKLPCFLMDTYTHNHDFFGREDVLKSLDDKLLPSKDRLYSSEPQKYRHVVLCGMAGLGKTELAIQYAYSRRHEFDAIFWVRAEDDNKLEADFAQIAARLGLEDPDEPAPPVVARELAKGWLANPIKVTIDGDVKTESPASWLIIFDNADDPNTLIDYMEVCGSGSLLITSRNPLAQTTFSPNSSLINLQPFTEEQSVQFLRQMTKNSNEPEAAAKIAKHFDGLPLAMVQMSGIIRQQFLTYSEFLEQYVENTLQNSEDDLFATEAQPLRQTARGNLASIWAIDALNKEARSVLEILSLLDPDCVQELILTEAITKDDTILARDFPTTKQAFTNARRQLQQSSLIRRNDSRNEYWLHRVLQEAVRSKMSKGRIEEVFTSCVWMLLQAWPAGTLLDTHNVIRWKTCEGLFPHILTLERMYVTAFKSTNLQGSSTDNLARLLSSATWWKHERGESHAILNLLEVALDVCSKSSATDMSTIQYDIHYTLASVGDETNNAALCLKHSQIVLDMELQRGNDTGDVRLAQAHNQIGIAYMISRDYERAKQAFTTSLDCWVHVTGFHKGLLSIATANLGLAHWHLNELEAAERVLRRGIQDREEQYGPNDTHSFRLGRLLHGLGNVQDSKGEPDIADGTFRKALAAHLATIGVAHHRTADVRHKVAQHCLRKGQLAEALALTDQALKAWSVDKKTYAPEIARTTFLKARVLQRQGKANEAERLKRLAMRQRKSLLGSGDARTQKDDNDLGQGDFDELVAFWSK